MDQSLSPFVGIDVSKDRLDVAVLPSGESWSTANWQSSYVRETGRDKVYLTTRSIANFLSADTTFWLEPLPEPEEEAEEGE